MNQYYESQFRMGTNMNRLFAVFLLVTSLSAAAVPEIEDASVNDIAITTVLNGQVVIVYNPIYCQQLGLLVCNFFRAHEYGHVNLGHVIRRSHPQRAEFEADCWAAQNAPLQQVQAAYQHFMANGFMGDWAHGTGVQRARRLAACAQGRIRR
jgi:predicted metal-dependent peptidase